MGYTIGSNKQMHLGGDGGITHGFPCTSLLPQILVVFSHFHRFPLWHFWHLCDPIETFDITSPPMPVKWRPRPIAKFGYWWDHEFGSEECPYSLSKWHICISQCPYSLVDALTYARVKSECQWKICSSRLISLHAKISKMFWWWLLTILFFVTPINLYTTGFTIWPHSFDSNANNILSSLFFQKDSSNRLLAQLRVKINNFIQRTSLEHSRTILDVTNLSMWW